MIQKTPIYIDLDRKRKLIFNLNAEILIRGTGVTVGSVFETVGMRHNPATDEDEPVLNVNPENLRVYLWAALQSDANANGETLTQENVGDFLESKSKVAEAVGAVLVALRHYYGDPTPGRVQGEATAPAGE